MAADGAQEARAHVTGAKMRGTAADGGPGARDGTKMGGAQRGGMWAHLRQVRCMGQPCVPQGAQAACGVCMKAVDNTLFHMDQEWTQLRYARLHADSNFIDISDGIHNLCEPRLSGLLRPEVCLGVGLGEHARQANEVSRGECKHVSRWPCCAAMFCAHGQGGDTAWEGCRCT